MLATLVRGIAHHDGVVERRGRVRSMAISIGPAGVATDDSVLSAGSSLTEVLIA